VVLVILVTFIILVLNPAEASKVDGRMLDVPLVEKFNNLGTSVSSQIAATSRTSTNLGKNSRP
jgi:hypothetical protein